MDASAEQIVLDYLRLLGDAAQRKLRPDERQAFLARTRAAIARQVSETRVAEPRDIQRLLRRFGDPKKLVAQERQRLDGTLPASAGAAPWVHRPMTARWRPGSDLVEPPHAVAPVPANVASPAGPAGGAGVVGATGVGTAGVVGPGLARDWLDYLFTMLRRHPLECAAIVVLGVGGLIDPFPLWMLGSLAVLVSRLWDTRDKLAAVAVPMAVALLGAITLAGLNARTPSLSGYAHGMHTDGWDIIRAGAVLGAVYLAWRLRQGPRPGRGGPPWQHITRGSPLR